MANQQQYANKFDFDAYNAVMKTANAGLQLHFARQFFERQLDTALRYLPKVYDHATGEWTTQPDGRCTTLHAVIEAIDDYKKQNQQYWEKRNAGTSA